MAIIQLASDTLAGTATAGQMEYNGTIQTFTPLGTQRGVVPAEQFFRLNAGVVGANINTVQSVFGVGVTLSASTIYEFEVFYILNKTAGTASHTISTGFGGTATINNIAVNYLELGASTTLPLTNTVANGAAAITATAASVTPTAITGANRTESLLIKGTVSINAGGTFIPQYTLSAAPGGAYTTQAGSYMKIKPIGVSGSNISVGVWS